MKLRFTLATALLLAAASACGEGAENGEIETTPELAARAKITGEAARTTALARVPGGTVQAGELEEEGGRLIYSFDIAVEGQSGIQEVQVDAVSGEVVSEAHETPADEAAEAKEDTTGALVETSPGLLARVKITDEAARAVALAKVPGGRIVGAELEEEGGLLIYSYDVKVGNKEGVEEVHVNALTGQVVSVEHEGEGEGGS